VEPHRRAGKYLAHQLSIHRNSMGFAERSTHATLAALASARLVGHIGVDIQVHDIDSCLRLLMTAAAVPMTFMRLDALNSRKVKASPLTRGRKPSPALSTKLIDQRRLASGLVPENVGAGLAIVSVIAEGELLASPYGTLKYLEGRAVHHSPCATLVALTVQRRE
jgi:hypothetical protein